MPNGVEFEGRLAHVGTFPIGIDPESFTNVSPSSPLTRGVFDLTVNYALI